MSELLPKSAVAKALVSSVPDWEWFLGQIESNGGRYKFPLYFSNAIVNLKIENYPLLYENENALSAVFFRGFMTDEELKEFSDALEKSALDDRGEVLLELCKEAGEFVDAIEIPKTLEQQKAAEEKFEALSEEDQKKATRFNQHFFASFFSSFHQMLSVMVHGEKLTSLVAQAKNGNDQALVKSVQIDRRCLTVIPYFKQRHERSQFEPDQDFSEKLAYRLRTAPYNGKIRHKSLYLTFSILDQTGLFDTMTHREILEFCDEIGVGRVSNRIEDVKYLTKRIADYRRFQKNGIASTP